MNDEKRQLISRTAEDMLLCINQLSGSYELSISFHDKDGSFLTTDIRKEGKTT